MNKHRREVTQHEVAEEAVQSKAAWKAVEHYMRGELDSNSLIVALQFAMNDAREKLEEGYMEDLQQEFTSLIKEI